MNGGINAGVGMDGSSRSINSLHGKNGRMMHRDHHNHRHGGRGGKAQAETSYAYPCMDRLLAWAKDYCGEFLYVLSWWSFSILFSLYNKEVFGEKKLDFPYPVTLTSTNMFFQWAAAKLLVKRWNRARVIDSSLGVEGEEEVDDSSIHDDHDDVDSFSAGGHIRREQMTPSDSIPKLGWREYLTKVVPCAVGLAMDIGLSNIALVHVTVTFYTIIKSTGPIFALIFGVMLGNEDPDIRVLGVVLLIVAGLLMASEGNADFKWLDFFTVLLATAVSGLRWNLLQMLLQGVPLLPTPMHVIEAISPASGIIMALFGICWEIPTLGVKPFFDNFSVGETILIGTKTNKPNILTSHDTTINNTSPAPQTADYQPACIHA
jgi:solute carrier family 35 protein C2